MEPAAPTMSRGAVSPIARDNPSIVPVRMPGNAPGRTWSRTICQRGAQRKAAWRSEDGTDRTLLRGDDNDRQNQQTQCQNAGQERRAKSHGLEPKSPHKQG